MKMKGFTLTEMIMVIIIMGVVFIGIGGFVRVAMQGYTDTVDRQGIHNQARFVIEKISREIRHAVPNSFEVTTSTGLNCLSFSPISAVGFYSKYDKDSGGGVINNWIRFAANNQGAKLTRASNRLTINPSRPEDLLTSSTNQSVSLAACDDSDDKSCMEYETSSGSGVYYYEMVDNFSSHSIGKRYFIYGDKVQYCIASNGDIIKAVGSNDAVIVGSGLDFTASRFEYRSAALQRGGLVHLELLFVNNGEQSFYQHDVQVLNVP